MKKLLSAVLSVLICCSFAAAAAGNAYAADYDDSDEYYDDYIDDGYDFVDYEYISVDGKLARRLEEMREDDIAFICVTYDISFGADDLDLFAENNGYIPDEEGFYGNEAYNAYDLYCQQYANRQSAQILTDIISQYFAETADTLYDYNSALGMFSIYAAKAQIEGLLSAGETPVYSLEQASDKVSEELSKYLETLDNDDVLTVGGIWYNKWTEEYLTVEDFAYENDMQDEILETSGTESVYGYEYSEALRKAYNDYYISETDKLTDRYINFLDGLDIIYDNKKDEYVYFRATKSTVTRLIENENFYYLYLLDDTYYATSPEITWEDFGEIYDKSIDLISKADGCSYTKDDFSIEIDTDSFDIAKVITLFSNDFFFNIDSLVFTSDYTVKKHDGIVCIDNYYQGRYILYKDGELAAADDMFLDGRLDYETFSCFGSYLGDVNSDDTVDISDVTYIQEYLADYLYTDEYGDQYEYINESDPMSFAIADVNNDGILDISDATALQMILAGYTVY